jgi:hypothetical protein
MDYIVAIQQTDPLTIHFSIYNMPDNDEAIYIPRLLIPLGYFIRLKVLNVVDHVIYESKQPKIKLKLHPYKPESYLSLDPGYSYGVILILDEIKLRHGTYMLKVEYSNRRFTGFQGHPIGEICYETSVRFKVECRDEEIDNGSKGKKVKRR